MEENIHYTLTAQGQAWLDATYEKLAIKMKAQCERINTMIPYSTRDGKYHDLDVQSGIYFWTNGFWTGMLWQMYEATGDECYKKAAEGTEDRLAEILAGFNNTDHDIGFLFLPSAVANYRKTGNEQARIRGLKAAQVLAGRYNLMGKFIRAWGNDDSGNNAEMTTALEKMFGVKVPISGWMIIDCLMNIPLLYWASETTKDPRYAHMAYSHAKTAQQTIVRGDGSCNHIVCFDAQTGEFMDAPGGQGYGKGSAWSRGQAWATYGFVLSYRHTGDESFLNTAKQCAHYCISSLSVTDWLPLVDYRAPAEPVKYDSTAGMITACGLLELAEHVPEHEKRLYVEAALRILQACDAKFSNWNPEEDSIMSGGTFFYHDLKGDNTEVPIIYGDYYFIEALLRLKGKALFIW